MLGWWILVSILTPSVLGSFINSVHVSYPRNGTVVNSHSVLVNVEAFLSMEQWAIGTFLNQREILTIRLVLDGEVSDLSSSQNQFQDLSLRVSGRGVHRLQAAVCEGEICVWSTAIFFTVHDRAATNHFQPSRFARISRHMPMFSTLPVHSGLCGVVFRIMEVWRPPSDQSTVLAIDYPFEGRGEPGSYLVCIVINGQFSTPKDISSDFLSSECHPFLYSEYISVDVSDGIVSALFVDARTYQQVLRLDYLLKNCVVSEEVSVDYSKGGSEVKERAVVVNEGEALTDEFSKFEPLSMIGLVDFKDYSDVFPLVEGLAMFSTLTSTVIQQSASRVILVVLDHSASYSDNGTVIANSQYYLSEFNSFTQFLWTDETGEPPSGLSDDRTVLFVNCAMDPAAYSRMKRSCHQHLLSALFNATVVVAVNAVSRDLSVDIDEDSFQNSFQRHCSTSRSVTSLALLQQLSVVQSRPHEVWHCGVRVMVPAMSRPFISVAVSALQNVVLPFGFQVDAVLLSSNTLLLDKQLSQFQWPSYHVPVIWSGATNVTTKGQTDIVFVILDDDNVGAAISALQILEKSTVFKLPFAHTFRFLLPTSMSAYVNQFLELLGADGNVSLVPFDSADSSANFHSLISSELSVDTLAVLFPFKGRYPSLIDTIALASCAKVITLLSPQSRDAKAIADRYHSVRTCSSRWDSSYELIAPTAQQSLEDLIWAALGKGDDQPSIHQFGMCSNCSQSKPLVDFSRRKVMEFFSSISLSADQPMDEGEMSLLGMISSLQVQVSQLGIVSLSSHLGDANSAVQVNRFHYLWLDRKYPDVEIRGFELDQLTKQVLRHIRSKPNSSSFLQYAQNQSLHQINGKILCITYTFSPRHEQAIMDTWGKRCDGYIASSNSTDRDLNAFDFPRRGVEEFGNIWQKVRATLLAVETHLSRYFDWFFVSGDDTYLFVDELRDFLSSRAVRQAVGRNNSIPFFTGQSWSWNAGLTFLHGGAGYVLNRAALSLWAERIRGRMCAYRAHTSMEDVLMADCLASAGVLPFDSRDPSSRHRFHHVSPSGRFLQPVDSIEGFSIGLDSRKLRGLSCCSRGSLTFHFLKEPLAMRLFHYTAYYSIDI